MVQTTGGLTDFSEEMLGKIQASCLHVKFVADCVNHYEIATELIN